MLRKIIDRRRQKEKEDKRNRMRKRKKKIWRKFAKQKMIEKRDIHREIEIIREIERVRERERERMSGGMEKKFVKVFKNRASVAI